MSFLHVSGISVEEDKNLILDDISFELPRYHKLAIAGETGSGKSTLLQTVAGLVQPSAGIVRFKNEIVKGPHDVLVAGHAGIAYLSQQYDLPKFLRVEQVLQYANTLTAGEATGLFELCRISHLLKRKTNQLSGGEKQRIALARLLVTSPQLLLLDEPYSNLDVGHKNILKSVIHDISDELEITCILISHDPTDTLSWADDILVMKNGKLVQQGAPENIYNQPVNEYTAALFGNYNLLSATHAAVFTNHSGQKKKDLLVRPEHFKLVTKETGAVRGIVKKLTFYGSYYELQVMLDKSMIRIRTTDRAAVPGNEVFVAIDLSKEWFL